MNKTKSVLRLAISIALVFTFSCSSGDDDGGGNGSSSSVSGSSSSVGGGGNGSSSSVSGSSSSVGGGGNGSSPSVSGSSSSVGGGGNGSSPSVGGSSSSVGGGSNGSSPSIGGSSSSVSDVDRDCTINKEGSVFNILCGDGEIIGELGDKDGESCWISKTTFEIRCGSGNGELKGTLSGCTVMTIEEDNELEITCGSTRVNLFCNEFAHCQPRPTVNMRLQR